MESVRREAEQWKTEAGGLASRLAECQASLGEADRSSPRPALPPLYLRRVASLRAGQCQRWEEFCRMADSMKNLSSDMLQQGHANKVVNGHLPV